jgi:glyoxylase-like metal-dependent hydrolase (beta-lactamase superfamily II)
MSAEVKILVEGYTNANEVGETGEEKTQPTITLVREKGLVMVVDPGILESHQVLIGALAEENLTVQDVDVVCVTHSHIDHYRNIGMFPRAKVLEYFGIWDKNSVEVWQEQFTLNIQVLRTPGHDYTGITVFVNTENGVVAICGDVFWKENYPEDPKDDKYASDKKELSHSRELIMKMADWIVPGHGPMYKTKKSYDGNIEKPDSQIAKKSSEIVLKCKKCRRVMDKKDKCLCRPWLCFRCCECGFDCDLCYCSHRKK